MDVPTNIANISIAHARLSAIYEAAVAAIQQAVDIDECKDWADKAAAMASYARQADDDDMFKHARRIQARALRRCQELLVQYPVKDGVRHDRSFAGTDEAQSRRQAAHKAGMSDRQYRTTMAVGNVSDDDFEAAVESDDPPTVTALAEWRTPAEKPRRQRRGFQPAP